MKYFNIFIDSFMESRLVLLENYGLGALDYEAVTEALSTPLKNDIKKTV